MKLKHIVLLLAISASVVSCSINNNDRKREIDPRTEITVQSVAGFELGKDGFSEVYDKIAARYDCPENLSHWRFNSWYEVDGLHFLGRKFDKVYFWFSETRQNAPLFMVEFEMLDARRADFELMAGILDEQYALYADVFPPWFISSASVFEKDYEYSYSDDNRNQITISMDLDNTVTIRYIDRKLLEEWLNYQGMFYQEEITGVGRVGKDSIRTRTLN